MFLPASKLCRADKILSGFHIQHEMNSGPQGLRCRRPGNYCVHRIQSLGRQFQRVCEHDDRNLGTDLLDFRRDDCATDNRGAEVSLTADGAAAFRRSTVPHLRAVQRHFGDALTPEQFEALAGILGALQDHLHPDSVARPGMGAK